MAVSDQMIATVVLFIFNYLVIYKKNRFMGNMVYMLIGIGLMYFFLGTLYMYAGLLIAIGSAVNLIYDLIS